MKLNPFSEEWRVSFVTSFLVLEKNTYNFFKAKLFTIRDELRLFGYMNINKKSLTLCLHITYTVHF